MNNKDQYRIHYEVGSSITSDGDIILFLKDSFYERLSTEVVRLKDEAVRKELIRLGWTPPPPDNNALDHVLLSKHGDVI